MMNLLHPRSINRCAAVLAAALMIFAAAWTVRPAEAQRGKDTVRLVIDYGDGISKTISNLAWAKGNTVLDAMKAATARRHGISFSYTGSGASAVLTKIDDVANEGGSGKKKNWQYWVNSVYGNRSFATFQLHAGDVILWRFATAQGTTEQGK